MRRNASSTRSRTSARGSPARRVGHEELAAGILEDRADQPSDISDSQIACVRSADSCRSFQLTRIEMGDKPVYEPCDRGFPASAPPRQEHELAFMDIQVDAADRVTVLPRVLERHLVEGYMRRGAHARPSALVPCSQRAR